MNTKTYAERLAEGERMKKEHKARLGAEYGLAKHPKFDALYNLAWQYGHASDWNEVEMYFDDMAKLLK